MKKLLTVTIVVVLVLMLSVSSALAGEITETGAMEESAATEQEAIPPDITSEKEPATPESTTSRTMNCYEINNITGEVSAPYSIEVMEDYPYRELKVGEKLTPDETGSIMFKVTLDVSGYYQIRLEDSPVELAMYACDVECMQIMMDGSWIHYFEAGKTYGFRAIGYSSITLTNYQPPSLQLNQAAQTGGETRMYAFKAPATGRYAIETDSAEPMVGLYRPGSGEPIFYEGIPSVKLETGQELCIVPVDTAYVKVVNADFNLDTGIKDIWLTTDREKIYEFPNINKADGSSPFYMANGVYGTYNKLKNPWIIFSLSGSDSKAILRDVKGKEIPCETWTKYQNIYFTQIEATGKTEKYSLTVIPENGAQGDSKTYDILINPDINKPKAPAKVTAARVNKNVIVEWDKVSGADGYYIYRAAGKAAKYTKIGTVKADELLYADRSVPKGGLKYKVVAYSKPYGKTIAGSSSKAISVK